MNVISVSQGLPFRGPFLGAVALAIVTSAIAVAQESASSAPAAAETQDAVDAATLAGLILAETGKLAATSSVTDYEASIMFAISQSNASDEVALAALDIVDGTPGLSGTMKAAIENIRSALRKKKLTRGTGAIGDSGISSSFSAPAIGLGGGSTNYTS